MNHQPKPEVKKCECCKPENYYKIAACGVCGHWHDITSMPSPASTEEWEKEFDELIAKTNWAELYDAIKSFIRSHDQQLRQRIVEGVLEDYSSWLDKNGYMDSDWYTEEPRATEAYLKSKSYQNLIASLN